MLRCESIVNKRTSSSLAAHSRSMSGIMSDVLMNSIMRFLPQLWWHVRIILCMRLVFGRCVLLWLRSRRRNVRIAVNAGRLSCGLGLGIIYLMLRQSLVVRSGVLIRALTLWL